MSLAPDQHSYVSYSLVRDCALSMNDLSSTCAETLCSITQLRWETGPVVPQELQQSLSAREMELFNTYDGILTKFTQVC